MLRHDYKMPLQASKRITANNTMLLQKLADESFQHEQTRSQMLLSLFPGFIEGSGYD
jgi:hypothetical protein